MYKLALLLFCCSIGYSAYSQGEEKVWALGNNVGVDFNSSNPSGFHIGIQSTEASAMVCNPEGQLLFYTDGTSIWDRNNNVMPNATNITDMPYVPSVDLSPTGSTTQGAVIIPMPDSNDKYYVFSLTSFELGVNEGRLYYSIVDMRLNGGLGDVVAGRKAILLDKNLKEKMTAVVGDRCNIWLLVRNGQGATFKAYEINDQGINSTPVLSNVGWGGSIIGVIKVSPNKKKIVDCTGLQLFDFDAASGIVSNPLLLSQGKFYGACFSPNSTRLYATTDNPNELYQYDLSLPAASIEGSKTFISKVDGLRDIKLASNGKIYIGDHNFLSCINYPDNLGNACGYTAKAISLTPGTPRSGMPNNIAKLKRDTTGSYVKINKCFQNTATLVPRDTSGWDYIWNTGYVGHVTGVSADSIYVVSYHTPPCVLHKDTFDVHFFSTSFSWGSFSGCGNNTGAFAWIYPGRTDSGIYYYLWQDSLGRNLQQQYSKHGDTLQSVPAGKYFVTVSSNNSCDSTFVIEVLPATYANSFITDSFICVNDSLHIVNTSLGIDQFKWLFGNGDTSIVVNPVYAYATPGNYLISLIAYPCHDTVHFTVTVDSMSYLRFTTDSMPRCAGNTITFYAHYPDGINKIVWYNNDNEFAAQTTAPTYSFSQAGQQVITIKACFRSCPDTSFSDTLMVYESPVVNLGTDTSICSGDVLTLRAYNVYPDSYREIWSNGYIGESLQITEPGIYWLKVISDIGCYTIDSQEVRHSCYLAVPNAFSPNGDGVNDYFFPRDAALMSITRFHMVIYTRWGQSVFETKELSGKGWDGTLNGVQEEEGVYVYVIEASFANSKEEKYTGNLTLIR